MIVQKYGTLGGNFYAHAALLSDVSHEDFHVHAYVDMSTLEECTDEYDDGEVSVFFNYVVFLSSLTPGRDLSHFWVVDSACSINVTAFRTDFVTFEPPSGSFRVGGV
jgi:hypothetical protein